MCLYTYVCIWSVQALVVLIYFKYCAGRDGISCCGVCKRVLFLSYKTFFFYTVAKRPCEFRIKTDAVNTFIKTTFRSLARYLHERLNEQINLFVLIFIYCYYRLTKRGT